MTAKLSEVLEAAEAATNQTYAHYFVNLASSNEKILESQGIVEIIKMTPPWLMFTKETHEEVFGFVYKDTLLMNLIYTLTSIWHQRFAFGKAEYQQLLEHLAWAFTIQDHDDPGQLLMPKDHAQRVPSEMAILAGLKNNRMLVFLAATILYIDTNILVETIPKK